jgi:hypothetical protein
MPERIFEVLKDDKWIITPSIGLKINDIFRMFDKGILYKEEYEGREYTEFRVTSNFLQDIKTNQLMVEVERIK